MLRLILCFLVAGFASGSVLYSMVLPRWLRGVDVVALSDDHNPGTANAMKLSLIHISQRAQPLCLVATQEHSRQTAVDKTEEGGDDVKSSCPL